MKDFAFPETTHELKPPPDETNSGNDAAARKVIKRSLVDRGLKQKDLAARAGMSEQVLSHFLRGRRLRLKPHEAAKLAEALGLTEETLRGTTLANMGANVALPPRRLRLVPVYPIGAGYEITFGDGDVPAGESLEEPICSDASDANAFAGKIVGASMDPGDPARRCFRENDLVLFDTKAEVRHGCFCLARLDDGRATFKQIFFEGDKIRLHALNPEINDEVRPRRGVTRLYRAVKCIQRL